MTKVDINSIWTCQENLEIKSKKYWGKLRVKKSQDTGRDYYDVLAGKKGSRNWHLHVGYSLFGDEIFCRERNLVNEKTKEITSQLHGQTSNEKDILKTKSPKIKFKFQVIIKGSTSESKVDIFEFIVP